MKKADINFKRVIRKALEVYTRKSLELEDINDEVFLVVCRKHIEETGFLPERWRAYIEEKLNNK